MGWLALEQMGQQAEEDEVRIEVLTMPMPFTVFEPLVKSVVLGQ